MVGYSRYDTPEEQAALNQIYRLLSFYFNYFQPSAKLTKKERVGAKVKKRYDIPMTPCRRVMELPQIPKKTKDALTKIYNQLNPAQLKRDIEKLQGKLIDLVVEKKRLQKEQKEVQNQEDFVYNLSEAAELYFITTVPLWIE